MKLDYLWISSFKNIENQEFNFGGKYIYSKQQIGKDKFEITRITNDQFVAGFFKIEDQGFENVTAIVGENGSGKTNTIEFIRGVITNRFIVYSERKRISTSNFIAIFSNPDGLAYTTVNAPALRIKLDFVHLTFEDVGEDLLTIFYSPVYDFRIFPIQSYPDDIDVSGNYLIQEDYENEKYSTESINQVELHKYLNSSRQFEFINSIQLRSDIINKIKIPGSVDVVINSNAYHHGSNEFWNTPEDFRQFFKILDEKHQNEINILVSEEHKHTKGRREGEGLRIKKEMFVSWTLCYLIGNLRSNIERTNHYLREGRVSIKYEDLEGIDLEEALIYFIQNQNLYPVSEILALIDEVNKMKQFIEYYDDGPQDLVKVVVTINKVADLQYAYLKYLNSMQEIAGSSIPYGFMNFDWHGLSTGEKVYLDLFSRIFYAKRKIYRSIEDSQSYTKLSKFPDHILLLLDEGEIGFHLQWQKEYLKLLIEVIPLLFSEVNVSLQLIFSTHSPISLSDIPRQNIIYLKKEDGQAKVLSKEERPLHSFGANIHELMHDAFYLKNGFMGDFAEGKIQKAINWCLSRENRQGADEVETLISMIDEPIIKVKLSEMFAAKMGSSVERARLLAQQELIQKRLQQLGDNDTN